MSFFGSPMGNPSIRNADGTVNVRCRKCGRLICKRRDPTITTVSECLICQGYTEEQVMQQYSHVDPTLPPIPRNMPDPVFLYEDEEKAAKRPGPFTGILKPLFRALGWDVFEDEEKPELASTKVAKRKHEGHGGLYER